MVAAVASFSRTLRLALLRWLLYPSRYLRGALRRHGDLPAFGDGTTFAALLGRVEKVAGALLAAGVRPGDRILLDLPNGPEFVETRLAALLSGVVAVPIPPGTSERQLGWIAENVEARYYVGPRMGGVPGLPATHLDPCGGERNWYESWLRNAREFLGRPSIDGRSLVTVNFTSGTTGAPKGVMSTAAGWGWSLYYALLENRVPLEPGETVLHAIPLATAGSTLILPAVLAGARSVFLREWDPEEAARLVEERRVTRIFLTPTMLAEFVDAVRAGATDVTSLKSVVYGTEGCPAARAAKAIGVLGPVLQQGYGMAEALPPICLLHPGEHERAYREGDVGLLGSAGRPTRAVDLGVFGEDGRRLPAGEAGSIRLRGRTVSPGYWRRPDLTAATRSGGYYVSGDWGYLDRSGYLHVLGREGTLATSSARDLQEWAEGQAEVSLSWVEEGAGRVILHAVPARGRGLDRSVLEERARRVRGAPGIEVRVHGDAPKMASYKLARS